jgi:hypothetical protein
MAAGLAAVVCTAVHRDDPPQRPRWGGGAPTTRRPTTRCGRVTAAAAAGSSNPRKKSDWELMDEELRGMRATSPQHRTVLGVDYGRRRTGLAVSSGGIAPRPLDVVPSLPPHALIQTVIDTALKAGFGFGGGGGEGGGGSVCIQLYDTRDAHGHHPRDAAGCPKHPIHYCTLFFFFCSSGAVCSSFILTRKSSPAPERPWLGGARG